MARMKKSEVIETLKARGISVKPNAKYRDLCKMLNSQVVPVKPPILEERAKKRGDTPIVREDNKITLVSKIPKRNTFMSDKYRDERDTELFNVEISKREHRGKIKTVTRIKQMEVDVDGFWVTECIIELKE